MNALRLALAATMMGAGFSPAQEAKEEKIDLAARQATIPVLEEHIKEREERLAETAADIMRLDKRVETKVDRIVKKLASIKDSQKSGYRVSQIKKKAMEGLGRSIKTYQSKRAALIQQAREGQTAIPEEVLKGDTKKFNEHIEKRIAQILEISKSYTQDADVEKYEQVSGGGWGWGDVEQISDEYRQNRRDRTMDKKQRDEIMDALKKSIERYESRIAGLKDSLANRTLSKTDRRLMEAELKHSESILDSRKEQRREMLEVEQPYTKSVTRNMAQDLQDALDDAAGDLRGDINTIFTKYAELNRERENVYKAKRNLEARKKWIADYIKECEEKGVKP